MTKLFYRFNKKKLTNVQIREQTDSFRWNLTIPKLCLNQVNITDIQQKFGGQSGHVNQKYEIILLHKPFHGRYDLII